MAIERRFHRSSSEKVVRMAARTAEERRDLNAPSSTVPAERARSEGAETGERRWIVSENPIPRSPEASDRTSTSQRTLSEHDGTAAGRRNTASIRKEGGGAATAANRVTNSLKHERTPTNVGV